MYRLKRRTHYLTSFLAGASLLAACGESGDDGGEMDSGLTANATLSGTGTPTTTGAEETGDDTMATDTSTTDPSTTDPSTTDPSTTDPSTTTTDGTTTTGGGGSPYMGGWDIGDCQDDVVAGVWSPYEMGPGVVLPDWYLEDSYGEMVRVRDFCHKALYFDYSALW